LRPARRVAEEQLGRVVRCSKCNGRFLADASLPPDAHVEKYAGEAPPVQVPPGAPEPLPPKALPVRRARQPEFPPVEPARPINPFGIVAVSAGFLGLALCSILWDSAIFWPRFLAALAAVIFGIAGCLHRPYWLALFGIVLGLFGMVIAVCLHLDATSQRGLYGW
jgi:hypothetical protein